MDEAEPINAKLKSFLDNLIDCLQDKGRKIQNLLEKRENICKQFAELQKITLTYKNAYERKTVAKNEKKRPHKSEQNTVSNLHKKYKYDSSSM